jgi:hypothetical protein
MDREHELALRLAEAQHTETELRRVIDMLLQQGDAVFASRSWRLGRGLTRGVEWLLRRLGRDSAVAQDSGHWRRIVAAHDDGLARRRALLEQLCRDDAAAQDLDPVLEQLWRDAATEDCVTPTSPRP